MKLHPEDPRLTAYVLGELDPEEAAAIEQAAAEDPLIREKIEEAAEIQRFLKERLVTPTSQLLPRQRENIRRNARLADRAAKSFSWSSFQPWLIPATAAAVLTLATFILIRMPSDKPVAASGKASAPVPATAANDPQAATPTAPPVPAASTYSGPGFLLAADIPTLELPVTPGKPGLAAITQAIRVDGKLPAQDSIHLEEMLNSFQLRLSGVSSIARSAAQGWHPDNRDSGMSAHVATLSTEMIACPWKPSATLLLISLRANDQKDCEIHLTYRANPENVFRYRLLGFPAGSNAATGKPATRLTAGSYTTLAIEIEPSKPGTELGSLEWSADDKPAPTISLLHQSDAEPSDDARFATLVCTYGQWLAGEQKGIIDSEILAALTRETSSASLPKDRADFLTLIDRSLDL